MSLPTIDKDLEQELLTVRYHQNLNWIAAARIVGFAMILVVVEAFGYDALRALPTLLEVKAADNEDAPEGEADPLVFFKLMVSAFSVATGIVAAIAARSEDKATDGKFNSTEKLYVQEMESHRAHARERMMHDNLSGEDADEICAVLEHHLRTTRLNRFKLTVRRFMVAFASFAPWFVFAFPALLAIGAAAEWLFQFTPIGAIPPLLLFVAGIAFYKGSRAWRSFDWFALYSVRKAARMQAPA